jgi:hypothetical protein
MKQYILTQSNAANERTVLRHMNPVAFWVKVCLPNRRSMHLLADVFEHNHVLYLH